jgi:cobalt/nickel transport system permease protein
MASRKVNSFMERTILSTLSILKETILNDEIALRKGFLQKVDPRIKSLCVLLLLAGVLFSTSAGEMAVIYLVTIILSLFSSIKLSFFLTRTLLFIPLFSACIVIPALFNVVTPGDAVFFFTAGGYEFSITRQGIDSAVIFFMRVLASVSLSVLLVLTTRHHVLLKVLRMFRVPKLFVMTLGMCYRYIFLFLDSILKTYCAIKSRVGYVASTKTGRKIVALNMAGLWLKSYHLHTQVYDAMLSRGWTGEPKVIGAFRVQTIDWITLAGTVLFFSGSLWLNHFSN